MRTHRLQPLARVLIATLPSLQSASWYQEFREVEERLRKASGTTFALSESIKQRESESNYAPIVDSIKAMLAGLNDEVIRAV